MRKLVSYAMIAFMCVAFLSATTLLGQEWSKDEKEVWKTVEDGWASWSKGDSDGAFGTIHDKYLGWNSEDPIPISKTKWMNNYNKYKEFMKVEHYDLDVARILVEGDNAVVYYYFEFYSVYEKGEYKKEKQMEGRNVEFYVKQGGKWMLLGDMTYFDEDDD